MPAWLKARQRGVIVAHPGTQHSYETAFGLQQAGLLQEYITGLYFKEGQGIGRVLPSLPEGVGDRALRELKKRRRAGIDEARVRTCTWLEAAYLAFAHAPVPASVPRRVMLLRNRLFSRLVAKRVRSAKPQAVICYTSCALEPFRAASRIGAVKILDQPSCHHNVGLEVLKREQKTGRVGLDVNPPPEWLIEQCTEEARQADLVLAGSVLVKESLVKAGIAADKVSVLPYGVDLGLFYPASETVPSKSLTAVYVGQLASFKGLAYLLEAFKGVPTSACRLLVIGGRAEDARLLDRYGVVFEHVPFVPRTELARLLRKADFFVYPSLLDGSALVTYEALASGLPVITTPNSGSVVRDGIDGFIVPPRDVDALRERIERLIRDRDLRQAMSLNARKRAEEYSWGKYHERLAALVRASLKLGGGPGVAFGRADANVAAR